MYLMAVVSDSLFAMEEDPSCAQIYQGYVTFDQWTNCIEIKSLVATNSFKPFPISRDEMRDKVSGDIFNGDPVYEFTVNEKTLRISLAKQDLEAELNKKKEANVSKNSFLITDFQKYSAGLSIQTDDSGCINYAWNQYGCGDKKGTLELNINTHPFLVKSGDYYYHCSEMIKNMKKR